MSPVQGPEPRLLLRTFLDLVAIDSEPGREGRVCSYIKAFFEDRGFPAQEDATGRATGGDCGNLIVRIPAGSFTTLPPIIICTHMDTVVPGRGIVALDEGDRFVSEGETVLGADDKAGVAANLAAVDALRGSGLKHRPLDLVFTVQEESGLVGAKHLDTSLVDGEWGVVLDGSGPVGGIIVKAPGRDDIRVTVRGRSAHAGVEPEKGNNAIACAAEAVAGLEWGRLDPETTMNVGLFSGGRAANVVPDYAIVSIEVRSLSDEKLEGRTKAVEGHFRSVADERGCGVDVVVSRSFDRFHLDVGSEPVRALSRAMAGCRVAPSYVSSGGGSDANVFNAEGIETAVMHIGIGNAHSTEEFITKDDLVSVANVVFRLALTGMDGEGS